MYQDCYCFDAAEHELIAEPFVPSATAAIQAALACLNPLPSGGIPTPPDAVDLKFCADSIDTLEPDPVSTSSVWVQLYLIGPEGDGHDYSMLLLDPDDAVIQYGLTYRQQKLWLCPVLLTYFPDGAPERLFVQITPKP